MFDVILDISLIYIYFWSNLRQMAIADVVKAPCAIFISLYSLYVLEFLSVIQGVQSFKIVNIFGPYSRGGFFLPAFYIEKKTTTNNK